MPQEQKYFDLSGRNLSLVYVRPPEMQYSWLPEHTLWAFSVVSDAKKVINSNIKADDFAIRRIFVCFYIAVCADLGG